MNKTIIATILFCLCSMSISAQVCVLDTLYLTSQEAIDDFPVDYPDCTEIYGSVLIEETIPGDITSLEALEQITLIDRDLIIKNNLDLVGLTGLGNLEMVGNFNLENNNSITSFIGLENLQAIKRDALSSIFGRFTVKDNPVLVNLEGLDNLENIDNTFRIYSNEGFLSLSGLNSINYIDYLGINDCPSFQNFASLNANCVPSISIHNCDGLSDLSGLEPFTKLDRILITSNDALISLDGLDNLDSLNNLSLGANVLLENINALSGLEYLSEQIKIENNSVLTSIAPLQTNTDSLSVLLIRGNPVLASLTGLSSYEFIKGFTIAENNALVDFAGLEGLKEIFFDAEIYGNESLQSCSGLQNLEIAYRSIYWNNNAALSSFEGLGSLKKIGRSLSIRNHPSIVDLTGLEQLDTIGQRLAVLDMEGIQSLDGLEGLEYLGEDLIGNLFIDDGELFLANNPQLSDISAISAASADSLSNITIVNNPLLELCSYPNICSYLTTGRPSTIENNALGCNNKGQVIQECFVELDHSNIVGTVSLDIDLNCDITNDGPAPNNIITFANDSLDWYINANEMGEYWMPLLLGEWNMSAVSPSSFWTSCLADTLLDVSATGDTILVDFPLQPMGDCSYIEWDLSGEDLRVCDTTTFVIDYCNYGTSIAEDLIITVSLDTFLTFQNSSTPHTIDGDGNIVFVIDDLAIFDCDQLSFSAFVDCDSLGIWDVQCVEVSLLSEELCPSDSLWDGSIIQVNGFCENDSIHFELENIGDGDMLQPSQFRVEIVIDDIILFFNADEYQLEADAIETLSYPVGNSIGMRIEADQSPGFPGSDQQASAVVANCNAIENNEIYLLLPTGEDGDPFSEVFCEPVVNSFDPNDKTAIPVGLTSEGLIEKDWTLDYRIRFQNTGNAPANIVVIRDLLSDNLDISTLKIKGASHSFTWNLTTGKELIFTFDNIMLPDSNSNEPASHGFVSFSITPKSTLLPGAEIHNSAGIYFDFNEPIITNTVRHKLRKPTIASSEHQDFCLGGSLMGIPIWSDTTFQFLTEGERYDSIHFLHLDVSPIINNLVEIEVPIGEQLAGTEIMGDTTFVVTYESQFGCDSLVTYDVSGINGINTLEEDFDQLKLYPNPVLDKLYILNNEGSTNQSWRLCNVLGQVVWQTKLQSGTSIPPIDLEQMNSGIYLLEVKTKNKNKTWKIIKQ